MPDFDTEAFIDGYIECALWADCLPWQSVRVRELQREIAEVYERGVRVPEHQLNELASLQEEEPFETGGGEDLTLRPGAREKMAADCLDFIEHNLQDLRAYCELRARNSAIQNDWHFTAGIEAYAGHDFWLTRNGHGAGFWDRGLGALGDRLTEAAKVYGTADDHTPFDCGDGTADV